MVILILEEESFLNTGSNVDKERQPIYPTSLILSVSHIYRRPKNPRYEWGGAKFNGTHIYLKAIYSDGVVLSNEVQVSQGFNKNYGPSIATDSQGNIIVTWNKFSLEGLFKGTRAVYARRFDSNLQALGDEFKVNVVY